MSDHAYYTKINKGSNTNKHYFLGVVARYGDYVLVAAWGRRGSNLQHRELAQGGLTHCRERFIQEHVKRLNKGYKKTLTQRAKGWPMPDWWGWGDKAEKKETTAPHTKAVRQKNEAEDQARQRRRNAAWNF